MTDKPSKYRSIIDNEKELEEKYFHHIDAYGGLFTPEMRMKLFWINPKNDNRYEDNSRDWSNIRKSVKNGLVDIQMICSIASFSQIEKMFEHTLDYPDQGKGGEISGEDHNVLSTNLVSAISSILHVDVSNDPKQRAIKEELEKERKEIVQSKIIGLEEKRRKLSLKQLKLKEERQKYTDEKLSFEKIEIKNEINRIDADIDRIDADIDRIDADIRIEKKPIELIDSKILRSDPKLQLWKAKLAKLMIRECFYFLIKNHFIKSPGYEEELNKVNLIIDSELSRYS